MIVGRYQLFAGFIIIEINWKVTDLTKPINAASHAAKAMYMKYVGIWSRKFKFIASAILKVHAVYIPNGNTAPQYSGSYFKGNRL